MQKAKSPHHATFPIIHGFFCKRAFSPFLENTKKSASTWPALQHIQYTYMGSISSVLPLLRIHSLHPELRHGHSLYSLGQIQRNIPMSERRCLPGFSRCMKLGCSRSPPSCSGTPATSVCCSSPGLRSFLRPRSAASWAPRIGRRTETGTYFYLHFNTPK